ncbi:MAG TPA: response regulator transcription factor [Actinotalea caeni]|uniref:response regulator transcription factor n=1 Tax=Actinotalea caeni TaxID=1348467 RepID=UPI002B4B2268|nr:response regulator transcription factor [Actinotalea caeni]HLV57025.1 response regulator transcription factor [Actinotalea caeni]
MTDTVRVLLVDDEPLVRSGLRAILGAEPGIEVVAEADDGVAGVAAATQHRPDVVLMDVRMPQLDGITATQRILERVPSTRVLVVTTFSADDYVLDALRAGAAGFLLKRADPAQFREAVRVVARGDAVLFPTAVRRLVTHATPQPRHEALLATLTDRERDVLRLLAAGRTNAEIAAELWLGVETVKTHVGNVLAKLGARDRMQAAIFAYESGFSDAVSGL